MPRPVMPRCQALGALTRLMFHGIGCLKIGGWMGLGNGKGHKMGLVEFKASLDKPLISPFCIPLGLSSIMEANMSTIACL